MGLVDMDNWKRIWDSKKVNNSLLEGGLEDVFMELKRVDGNDTVTGGVEYEAYCAQYKAMYRNLLGDKDRLASVFEAGCGSGPFLLMFQTDGMEVGGMDYSAPHIEAAAKVLRDPLELYCDEAIHIKTELKYDCVYSNSMFEYFENMEYAETVLEKMCEKSKYSVAVLDVHDKRLEQEYLDYRRSVIENYDEHYKGLHKLFYERSFFIDFAIKNKMDIKITMSKLQGYWNADFVYDVYLYKN